jgi:hypothetical protein
MDSYYVIHHTILEKCIGVLLMSLMCSFYGTFLYIYQNKINPYNKNLSYVFIVIFIFIIGAIIFGFLCLYIFDRFIMDQYVFIKP